MNALARTAPRVLRTTFQRRAMGGHAAVEYTGIEASVRKVLPKDEHIVLGILGGYFGLYLVVKAGMAMSPAKPEVAAPAVVESVGGIPDVEDAAFGTFIESESNLNKLIDSWSK